MRIPHLTVFVVLVGLLATLLGACSTGADPKLQSRALEFYKNAHDTNAVRGFFTPLIQQSLPEKISGSLAMTGVPTELTTVPLQNLQDISPTQVSMKRKGKWAKVEIEVETLTGIISVPTFWIKIEDEWYLFTGSSAEINEYGKPPTII